MDKGLGWGGGTEARTRCGDMFICLLFIISVEVTLLNYSQHLLFILISLISQSPISPIKFLVCALIFIKLVISASMLYTFPELLSHKLLIILLIFLHFCFSKFLL